MNGQDTSIRWYVLRVTYQRELILQESLDQLGIENYVPMRMVKYRNAQGQFSKKREVAIHNYIFVHSSRAIIDELKTFRFPVLRYVMQRASGESIIMVVPDEQMQNFIAVAAVEDQPVTFLSEEEESLFTAGDRVQVTKGVFAGVRGVLTRIGKMPGRRVVVKIEGLMSVATASIASDEVEKI